MGSLPEETFPASCYAGPRGMRAIPQETLRAVDEIITDASSFVKEIDTLGNRFTPCKRCG
jgi:hypothetical protein